MPITTLEELNNALSQHPQSADILEYINSAIESEKSTGIKLKSRANAEAHAMRKWKQAIEALGYDQDDPDALADWLAEKTKVPTRKPDENQPNPEIEKMKKEFARAQKALADAQEEAKRIKQTSDRRTMKGKLVEALRDKVYGHDLLADNLITDGKVRLSEDESIVFLNGDDEIEFDKGLKKLLDSRPDLLKNTQTGGARSGSRPVSGNPKFSLEQIKTMSQEDIAANLDDVKASMKAYK